MKRPISTMVCPSLALMLLPFLTSCSPPPSPADTSEESSFMLGGIQVNEPELEGWLDALEGESMNTVSITDYARQGDWDSAQLSWHPNPVLLDEIRGAKERDMKVVFIARVALDESRDRNRFLWHGMIMPRTDEDVHAWFDRYTEFVLHWAKIAESEKIDVLMIGSELNALASTLPLDELPALEEYFLNQQKQEQRRDQTLAYQGTVAEEHLRGKDEKHSSFDSLEGYLDARIASEAAWAAQTTLTQPRPGESKIEADARALNQINARRQLLEDRWRQLIQEVRQVYGGRLGYSANFDQYTLSTFWNALDVMGVNAYFQIRRYFLPEEERSPERLYPMLEKGWADVLQGIEAFRREHQLNEQSILFTELGYTYRANSTLNPWAHTGFGLIESHPKEDGTKGEDVVVVWNDQPIDPMERALAIRALYNAHTQLDRPFLDGLLYWKLSTVPSHREVESFVLVLGEEVDDPVLEELRLFRNG